MNESMTRDTHGSFRRMTLFILSAIFLLLVLILYVLFQCCPCRLAAFDVLNKNTAAEKTLSDGVATNDAVTQVPSGDESSVNTPPASKPASNPNAPKPQPPSDQPPSDQPPATQPPSDSPPSSQPPADQPPADQPPASDPPPSQPPASDPPASPPADAPPGQDNPPAGPGSGNG